MPPRAFLKALRGSVEAVVFTTLPVHPREAIAFNKNLYSALRRGRTIEEAVQAARAELQNGEPPLQEDSASFGWFGLLTGQESGLQLLETPVSRTEKPFGELGASSGPDSRGVKSVPHPSPSAGRLNRYEGEGAGRG